MRGPSCCCHLSVSTDSPGGEGGVEAAASHHLRKPERVMIDDQLLSSQ